MATETEDRDPLLVGLDLIGDGIDTLQRKNLALRMALKEANEHLQRIGWSHSGGTGLRDRIIAALKPAGEL